MVQIMFFCLFFSKEGRRNLPSSQTAFGRLGISSLSKTMWTKKFVGHHDFTEKSGDLSRNFVQILLN